MKLSSFDVVGISVRTTNENQQMGIDIPKLWERFFSEGILEKIPNKIESSIYSIYTDYEGDHMKPYTVILGCKVANLNDIPKGMVGKTVSGGAFTKFTAKGNLNAGAVYEEWVKIWNSDLNRKFTADFEVYDDRAQNPEDAEVDICIATH